MGVMRSFFKGRRVLTTPPSYMALPDIAFTTLLSKLHRRWLVRAALSFLVGGCLLAFASVGTPRAMTRVHNIDNHSELCHTAIGIMTSDTLFEERVLAMLGTWIPDICPSATRVMIQVGRHQGGRELASLRSVVPSDLRRHVFIIESACPPGYDALPCRTRELLRQLHATFPESQWFIKADDDSLILPAQLNAVLGSLNSSVPLAAGAGSFYYCNVACTHTRYPRIAWSKRLGVENLIRGGSGYILSSPAVAWMNENHATLLAYGEDVGNLAEDVMLFRALTHELPGFVIHHLESFYFHRPDVAVSYSSLHGPVRRRPVPPAAFHMMHDLDDISGIYGFLTELPAGDGVVEPPSPWDSNPCSPLFNRMRASIRDTYQPLLAGIKQVAVVGVPDHSNRGDSVIYVGELHLFDDLGIAVVYESYVDRDYDRSEMAAAFTVPDSQSALILHGGGNWGDLYKVHHNFRLRVMQDFPTIPVVSFPNTLTARSDVFWAETTRVIGEHKAPVTVVGRDTRTTEAMASHLGHLPGVTVKMCTDMAFYMHLERLDWSSYSTNFFGVFDVLITSRGDSEVAKYPVTAGAETTLPLKHWDLSRRLSRVAEARAAAAGRKLTLHQTQHMRYLAVFSDDWLGNDPPGCERNASTYRQRAESRAVDGLAFLRRGKIGLTNRLHAHILMTLMNVPHVVMDTKYNKVKGFYSDYTYSCQVGCLHNDLQSSTEAIFDLLLGEKFLQEDWKSLWRS